MYTTKNIETRDVPLRRMEGAPAPHADWTEKASNFVNTMNELVTPDGNRIEEVFTREQTISPYIGVGRVYQGHLARLHGMKSGAAPLPSLPVSHAETQAMHNVNLSTVNLEKDPNWVNPAFEYPLGPPRMEDKLTSMALPHPQGHAAWSFKPDTNDNFKGVSYDTGFNDREFEVYRSHGNNALLKALTVQAAQYTMGKDTRTDRNVAPM